MPVAGSTIWNRPTPAACPDTTVVMMTLTAFVVVVAALAIVPYRTPLD